MLQKQLINAILYIKILLHVIIRAFVVYESDYMYLQQTKKEYVHMSFIDIIIIRNDIFHFDAQNPAFLGNILRDVKRRKLGRIF